ncbi:MAG: PDZ domain-containing protein [Actinomycetales bacterium]|nr:PDZ domain-containing protein [Actinomycetales bacterium]
MTHRARVLVVSAASLIVLLAVALLLPVPFVKMAPGPTYNVVGDVGGVPVIDIEGTTTYPTTGDLDMTTVMESGGPRGGLTFVEAIGSWFNPADAVLPRELIYPDDVSGEDVKVRQAALFSTAESNSVAAALNYLGKPVRTELVVTAVYEGTPASGKLEPRDRILAVDGTKVTEPKQVGDAIRAKPIGTTFTFTVERLVDGALKTLDEQVTSQENPDEPGVPQVGIGVGLYYAADFDITFTLKDVGGPSAGMMFALGLVDKLTPQDLAQGRHIAGTGTITPEGEVGTIGGIRQKLAGARGAGAELFLMPAAHCAEAAGHIPDGLTVVPIKTLADAVTAVQLWTSGRTGLAACPAEA